MQEEDKERDKSVLRKEARRSNNIEGRFIKLFLVLPSLIVTLKKVKIKQL